MLVMALTIIRSIGGAGGSTPPAAYVFDFSSPPDSGYLALFMDD